MRSLILYLYSICASDMHTLRKGSCLRIWRRAAGGYDDVDAIHDVVPLARRRLPPRGVDRCPPAVHRNQVLRARVALSGCARASEGRGRAGVQGVFEEALDLVHGDEDGQGGRDHDDGVVGFCVREVSVGAVSIWQRLRGESGTCFVCARAVCVWSVSCKACQGRRQTKWWGAGRT